MTKTLDDKIREKIYYNIRKSQVINDKEIFKKLNDNIWEFRTLFGGKAYRLFAFWDIYEKFLVPRTALLRKLKKRLPKKYRKQKK